MPTKKIYTNTLAQIAGKLATALISIVLIKILTNYLDVAGYGLYSKIYNYLSIFSVIADLWLYTITVREIAEHREDRAKIESILGNVLTLRAMMGFVIILFSLWLSFFLPGYDHLMAQIGIIITGFFTLFGLVNSSIMSYLQATLQTEKSAIGNIAGKFLTLGLIILFATIVAPMSSSTELTRYTLVMFAGLAGNILMTYYTYRYAAKLVTIHFHFNALYLREIFHKSLPYGIALFLNVIFFKVDVLLLSFLESHTTSDISIALYSVPMKMVEVGMMYGTIFLNSLLPELAGSLKRDSISAYTSDDGNTVIQVLNPSGDQPQSKWNKGTPQTKKSHTESKMLIEKWFKILFFFGLGISAFLSSFSSEILTIISSEKFVSTKNMGYTSLDAMHIVAWIFALYFVSSLATYVMIALGKEKKMIAINGAIALLNIVGNLILIPHFSFYGSAIASLFSQVVLIALTAWQVRAYLPWKPMAHFSLFVMSFAWFSMFLSNFLTFSIFGNILGGWIIFSIFYGWWTWMVNKKLLKNI